MEELEIVIEKEIDSEQLINVLEEEIREIHPNYEELTIVPTTEAVTKVGSYNKVTVAGDSDLIPENIKEGVNIFGVDGTAKVQGEPVYITNAAYLFNNGARLDYLNGLLALCKDVTDMQYMFNNCTALTSLDLSKLDTSKVTNMSEMFDYCRALTSLDLSNFDTSNVTDMRYMFYYCNTLKSLNVSSFNTSKVTNTSYMFYQCSNLTSLDLSSFDTSNVTTVDSMLYGLHNLTTLDLSNLDFSKVNRLYDVLGGQKLQNLISFKNLGKGYTELRANYGSYAFGLGTLNKLTHDSLIDVMTNGLYDLNLTYNVANGGTLYTQKFVLGSTNLAKLTAEEIAIATAKGWTVS